MNKGPAHQQRGPGLLQPLPVYQIMETSLVKPEPCPADARQYRPDHQARVCHERIEGLSVALRLGFECAVRRASGVEDAERSPAV